MAAGLAGEQMTGGLSSAELAERAGASGAELERMVVLGIPVRAACAATLSPQRRPEVLLAKACERAGLPMDGIGLAIEQGRVSFSFLETTPFRRWAQRWVDLKGFAKPVKVFEARRS